MPKYEIAVLGGGASGLAAAVAAGRLGAKLCVVEAQPRVGKKLLATGNGRCNLSNTEVSPESAAEHYRCDSPDKLRKLLEACPAEKVLGFLSSLGLEFREEQGRVYPRSEKASAVLDMLRFELEKLKVDFICGSPVDSVEKINDIYIVSLKNGDTIEADCLIIALGSPASPSLSGRADGAGLMRRFGHKPSPFCPSLAPINAKSPFLKQLKGTRVHCSANLLYKGKLLHTESGELQFNDGSLSGIMIFQLAARLPKGSIKDAEISVDLLPEYTLQELEKLLDKRRKALAHLQNEAFLTGLLPKPVACVMLKLTGLAQSDIVGASIDEKELKALVKNIKQFNFTQLERSGFAQAQTSSGGVGLAELNEDLESKLSKGLFCCGELIDCDGDCGGFNLHFAWLSGIIAGEAAAAKYARG